MKQDDVMKLLQNSGLIGIRSQIGFITLAVLLNEVKTGDGNVDIAGIELTKEEGLTIKCRKDGQAEKLFLLLKKEGFKSVSMDPKFSETHPKYGKFLGSVNIKNHLEILRFVIELCMCTQNAAKDLYEVSGLKEQYPEYAKQYSESVSKSEKSDVSTQNLQNSSDGLVTKFKKLFAPASKVEEQPANSNDYISGLPNELILLIWQMLSISDQFSFYKVNKKIKNSLEKKMGELKKNMSDFISEQAFKSETGYHEFTGVYRMLTDVLHKSSQKETIDSSLDTQKTINLYYDDKCKKQLILFAYKPASNVTNHEVESITFMLRGDLPLTSFFINRIHAFVTQHQLSKACFLTAEFNEKGSLSTFRGGMTNNEILTRKAFPLINIAEHLIFLKLAYVIKKEFNTLKSKLIESPTDIAQEALLKHYKDFEKCFVLSIHPTELKDGLIKFKDELTKLKDDPTKLKKSLFSFSKSTKQEFIDSCNSSIKKIEALLKEFNPKHQQSLSSPLRPF